MDPDTICDQPRTHRDLPDVAHCLLPVAVLDSAPLLAARMHRVAAGRVQGKTQRQLVGTSLGP